MDSYSLAVAPAQGQFGGQALSSGTVFFWDTPTGPRLVTNWHVVTGKNPRNGKHISQHGGEPDNLRVWLPTRADPSVREMTQIDLFDSTGSPLWSVHPSLRHAVDVVALDVAIPATLEPRFINSLPSEPRLRIEIGQDLFVLGYPYEHNVAHHPIWKRGSLASDPNLVDPNDPYWLVDTASRPGMSGAPVIRRSWGMMALETGEVVMGPPVSTRFAGVYSGRIVSKDPLDAQLGMVWPADRVEAVISGGIKDDPSAWHW